MITIRPSIFCFFGKLAPDLYGMVPVTVRRRLGAVPDVFAFLSVTAESVDLKLGTRRPILPSLEGNLQNSSDSLKQGAYRTKPVRTVYTPKPSGQLRGGARIISQFCLDARAVRRL